MAGFGDQLVQESKGFGGQASTAKRKSSKKRKGAMKGKNGKCYSGCRSEKRRDRIKRFGYGCDGYFVCTKVDDAQCD